VELIGNLCEVKFIMKQKFLHPFYLMIIDKLLEGNSFSIKKNVGEVGIDIAVFSNDKFGVIDFCKLVRIMDHFDNDNLDLLYQDSFSSSIGVNRNFKGLF
jgi:hypothetical protein